MGKDPLFNYLFIWKWAHQLSTNEERHWRLFKIDVNVNTLKQMAKLPCDKHNEQINETH